MTASRTLSVLIVEDDPDGGESLAVLLTHAGHEVRLARTPAEALDGPTGRPPDVVLLDIGLPDMDGHELAGRLRARYAGPLLLVAVTGRSDLEGRSFGEGLDYHFVKPVDLGRLRDLLAKYAARLSDAGPAG